MARATKDNLVLVESANESIQGTFANNRAFSDSFFAETGAVTISDDFGFDGRHVGDTITRGYYGVLPDFEDVADGAALTPNAISQIKETCQVTRSGLAFESTYWADQEIYSEMARQVGERAKYKMDAAIVAAAIGPNALSLDVSSSTSPRLLDMDSFIDGLAMFEDAQDRVAGAVVHHKVWNDLLRMRDSVGRPMLTTVEGGDIGTFMGVKIYRSGLAPITGTTMGAVTSTGTSPPVLTLSGTPANVYKLRVRMVVGGTLGTATFQFSTDGGNRWSSTMTTGASVALTDPAVDSLVGKNGASGITAAFAAGTYNANNTYASDADAKYTTLLLKKGAIGFWYNREALVLDTDKDVLRHSQIGAINLYSAAVAFRRLPYSIRPGVAKLITNATK